MALTPSLETSDSLFVKELIYEPLLVPDDKSELSPRLARTWRRLPGGNIYVEIDTNRRFSDSSPVTLQDVIDSLTAAGLRPSQRESGLEIASGAGQPRPELSLFRASIFKKVATGSLGTGAFVVVSQDRDRIVLQRSVRVRNHIDRVELVAYATEGEALAAVLTGKCNAIVGLQPGLAELAGYASRLRSIPVSLIHHLAIIFNHNLLQPKERKVLLAHLRDSHLENVDPDALGTFTTHPVSLDPGPKLSIVTWNAEKTSHRLALAVQRILGPRGGEVVQLSPPEAAAAVAEGRFGIIIGPFRTWPDAEGLALWRSGGPLAATGYSNAALDGALDAGDWKAARQVFDLDPPGLFPMEWRTMALLDPRIVNPTFGRYLRLETLPSWEVR